MIRQVASIRYAKAYYTYSLKTNLLKETVLESEKIIEILSNNASLSRILKNKIVPNKTKKDILSNTFGNLSENLKNLIELLVRKNRLYLFNEIISQFIEIYKIRSGSETAYLVSAENISNKIQESLKHVIMKITKNKIKIVNVIDKDLIGGFIVKVGDMQFDHSVNSKLNNLKTILKRENTSI